MNLIGYLRVSTEDQADSGLGLHAQEAQITAHAERNGVAVSTWRTDSGVSGKTPPLERVALRSALDAIGRGEADGLIVAKLDRLSRSMKDFTALLAQSQEEGWSLVILDLGVDTTTPNGRFLAHIIASVAQLERELIGQRTSAALQAKRASGWRRACYAAEETVSTISSLRSQGLSLGKIAALLNELNVPTPRGGKTWRSSSVRSVLLSAAGAAT